MLECPNCRRMFQPGTRFCGTCGTALAGAVPAIVSQNDGCVEPSVSRKTIPGFHEQDSPEDTLVRKKPAGISWQLQSTNLLAHEPQQDASPPCARVEEEATVSRGAPGVPISQANEPATAATSPSFSNAQPFHHSPVTSVAEPLMVDNPAQTTLLPERTFVRRMNEPLAFTIPGRPGRGLSEQMNSASLVEGSGNDETHVHSSSVPSKPEEPLDQPGIMDIPSDTETSPIDYSAFADSIIDTVSTDSLMMPVPETKLGPIKPVANPFAETFISSDFLAEIETLSSLPTTSSATGFSERETMPSLEELIAPVSSLEVTPAALPTTPAPANEPSSLWMAEFIEEADAGNDGPFLEVPVNVSPLLCNESGTLPGQTDAVEAGGLLVDAESAVSEVQLQENDLDITSLFAPYLKPGEVSARQLDPNDPYLHLKQELAAQRMEITAAMDELLPLVYENHRQENQELFAYILAHRPALDDEAWGHAAFVLGAYGNYMYRHPLSFAKKLEIWHAQLWAVYYERSYRRKYLAQRCQQLIHFFQGCAEHPLFLAIALHDLETLYLYLEPGSLRKLQGMLQALPHQPLELLQGIEAYMEVAEQEKAERMAKQPASSQSKTQPNALESTNRLAVASPQSNARTDYVPVQALPRDPGRSNGRREMGSPALAGEHEELAQVLFTRGHQWLDFLSEDQQYRFFESLRADRLEVMSQLLRPGYKQILSALRARLLQTTSPAYQRPRRSVPVYLEGRNGSEPDRFNEAFRLLTSPKLREQQSALRMFEQNARENIKQEYQQGAREWVLYARTLVLGSTRAVLDWERAYKRGEASWEEIWNLAYYHYAAHDLAEAARILTPGLDELDAPIAHLRLALLCALTLLLESEALKPSTLQDACHLLIRHLERWPHPLSCLAWLVLNYETPGALRPLDQSRRLSVFQELLEYPVDLPDPRIDLTEAQLYALRDALTNKIHCEEAWFLWLNDYAARRPRNFLAWQTLAETSEHLERLERAELALQHIAGMYYDLDYVYAQDREEVAQATEALRAHVEKLFAFYRRHEMQRQAWDSFESCYATLQHLGFWDERKSANRGLLALVRPFLLEHQRQEARQRQAQHLIEAQDARSRSEIRRNELSNNPTMPLEHFQSGRRVGIFVDYENIARLIPPGKDMEDVWQTLASYAAQFGEVICRWASASPRNLTNLTDVRSSLEAAQFQIRYPRRELQFSASQKDLADYALLECITNASLNDRLDVYLVVSGDRDYYERIYSLLEAGRNVRILASACNLSTSYRELVQQRQHKHNLVGHEESDFFIDDLDEVLRSFSSAIH